MESLLTSVDIRHAEGDRWLYIEDVPPIAHAPRELDALAAVGVPQLMKLHNNIRKAHPDFTWNEAERDLNAVIERARQDFAEAEREDGVIHEEHDAWMRGNARHWARPVVRFLETWDKKHPFVPHALHQLALDAEDSSEGVTVLADALLENCLILDPPRKRRRSKKDQALEDFKARHLLLCRAHIWALHELRLTVNRRRLPGTHRSVLSANIGCPLQKHAHYKDRCIDPARCINLTEYGRE